MQRLAAYLQSALNHHTLLARDQDVSNSMQVFLEQHAGCAGSNCACLALGSFNESELTRKGKRQPREKTKRSCISRKGDTFLETEIDSISAHTGNEQTGSAQMSHLLWIQNCSSS